MCWEMPLATIVIGRMETAIDVPMFESVLCRHVETIVQQ
jgi:hypothetical protein